MTPGLLGVAAALSTALAGPVTHDIAELRRTQIRGTRTINPIVV